MLQIYAVSKEYVAVPVSNNEGFDPTPYVVEFGFLGPYSNVSQALQGVPSAGTTYYTGFWQTAPPGTPPNQFIAAILVGPGGGVVTLASGTYLVIVQIQATPQNPVLFSGPMVVS